MVMAAAGWTVGIVLGVVVLGRDDSGLGTSLALDIDGPTFELSGQGDGFLRGRALEGSEPTPWEPPARPSVPVEVETHAERA